MRRIGRIGWNDAEGFGAYFPEPRLFVDDWVWLTEEVRINCFRRVQAQPIIVRRERAFEFDLRESQLPRLRASDPGDE